MIRETDKILAQCSGLSTLCASYEELHESGLSYEGVVVSPGNGFGIMDGGFDRVLRDVHGVELEQRIKRAIIRMYGPEMPVGCAVSSAATGGQRVIYAPTMQVPMALEGSDNVYRAARAAAHLAKTLSVRTLWMPLMGTGAGSLPLCGRPGRLKTDSEKRKDNIPKPRPGRDGALLCRTEIYFAMGNIPSSG